MWIDTKQLTHPNEYSISWNFTAHLRHATLATPPFISLDQPLWCSMNKRPICNQTQRSESGVNGTKDSELLTNSRALKKHNQALLWQHANNLKVRGSNLNWLNYIWNVKCISIPLHVYWAILFIWIWDTRPGATWRSKKQIYASNQCFVFIINYYRKWNFLSVLCT